MYGNLQVLAMGLFDNGREFGQRDVLPGGDLDDVHILKNILSNCLACTVRSIKQQKFLLQDSVGKGGIGILKI
jgi:hypothetical protein